MAVESAGPYANNLHLTPDRQPHYTSSLNFLQAGCPSCRPTNSVKAPKAQEQNRQKHVHHYHFALACVHWTSAADVAFSSFSF